MPTAAAPSDSGSRSIPDRVRAFERDWSPDRLAEIAAEPAVARLPAGTRRALLSELVQVDLRRAWAVGEQRTVEHYLAAHPDLASPPDGTAADGMPADGADDLLTDLLRVECEARARAGEAISMKRLRARFPARADAVRTLLGGQTRGGKKRRRAATHAAAPLLPEIFGRYRVLKLLGEGAMGAVHLAEDTQLHRRVALKTPTLDTAADAGVVDRFYREARTAATLRHPNICPVHDVGEQDGRLFLTMAFIEGRSMDEATGGPQPIRAAVTLVRKIADAMAHAHAHGIIHRDLKPANVMLDERGEPLVMDFGLARHFTGPEGEETGRTGGGTADGADPRLTSRGTLLGSPAYMSPEQIRAYPEEIGPQSDVYSLGVMLFELLTGDLPFHAASLPALLGRILTQDPPPPSSLRPEVSPRLETIWRTMVARDRGERYVSMAEVRDALAEYLANDTALFPALAGVIPPGPLPSRHRSKRSAGSRWLLTAGLAAAVAVLLGVVTITDLGPDGTPQSVTVDVPGEVTDVGAGGGGAEADAEAWEGLDGDPFADPGADEGTDADDGWVDLFNGRDLKGWSGDSKVWSVENGELVADVPAGAGAYKMLTFRPDAGKQLPANPELALAFTASHGAIVKARVRKDAGGYVYAELGDWASRDGGLLTEFVAGRTKEYRGLDQDDRTGRLRRAAAAAEQRGGETWHDVRLTASGRDASLTINGVEVRRSTGPIEPDGRGVVLAVTRSEADAKVPVRVRFRSVRVRPLNPEGTPITWPVLYADDFSEPRLKVSAISTYADGVFRIDPEDGRNWWTYRPIPVRPPPHFRLHVRGRVTDDPSARWGVLLGVPGEVREVPGTCVLLDGRGHRVIRPKGVAFGTAEALTLSEQPTPSAALGEAWNALDVRLDGRTLRVAVNGESMGEPYEMTEELPTVQITLFCRQTDGGAAEFDDLTLWGPPGTGAADADVKPSADEGWTDLLAGGVDGWERWSRGLPDENAAKWRVEDGTLVGTLDFSGKDGWRAGYLVSPRDLTGDFEVTARIRTSDQTDAGVTLREPPRSGRRGWIEFNVGEVGPLRKTGGYDSHLRGVYQNDRDDAAVARAFAARAGNGAPDGWDVVELRVRGDRVTETVNGVETVDRTFALPRSARFEVQTARSTAGAARVEVSALRVRALDGNGGAAASPMPAADTSSPPSADERISNMRREIAERERAMSPIYRALKVVDAEVVGGPHAPGDEVLFTLRLENMAATALKLPPDPISEGTQRLAGSLSYEIERRGEDPAIPVLAGVRRTGRKYLVAAERVILAGSELAAGEEYTYRPALQTKGFPPGTYTYHIEYRSQGGHALRSVEVPFELVDR